MKIRLFAEIDPKEAYKLVKLLAPKQVCSKQIRRFAKIQFTMMLQESDGGWIYPNDYLIAQNLIDEGLAEPLNTKNNE